MCVDDFANILGKSYFPQTRLSNLPVFPTFLIHLVISPEISRFFAKVKLYLPGNSSWYDFWDPSSSIRPSGSYKDQWMVLGWIWYYIYTYIYNVAILKPEYVLRVCVYTHIHIYIYMHTYVRTYIHTYLLAYIHTSIHVQYIYIHIIYITYIHACMHRYMNIEFPRWMRKNGLHHQKLWVQ